MKREVGELREKIRKLIEMVQVALEISGQCGTLLRVRELL